MRSRMKKAIALWLAVIWIGMLSAAYGQEGSAGILYKVQNKEVTVYLLGSIHVGSQEMYPFGRVIREAMENSDIFVFECDTTSKEAIQATRELMFYQDGTRIRDVISQPLYEKLKEVCTKENQSIQAVEKMRPWAAMSRFSLNVTAAEMGTLNAAESILLGVEATAQRFVAENPKPIEYLETTEEQLKSFDRMSMPLQEYLLDEALSAILNPEAIAGMDKTIRHWPAWWRDGDIQAFADSYRESYLQEGSSAELLEEYHRILMTERNQSMADRVSEYLQGTERRTYFITVGLLHLVLPEDSILKHLENYGYGVECLSIP